VTFKESDILQRWVVTTDGCPTCSEIKKDFKKEIKAGTLKFTDVGDDKGFEIVTALGIDEVPVFIVELKHGHPSGIKYILDE
jgi:predicted DCC family thiol-disulfide oxidoreductase YuxK